MSSELDFCVRRFQEAMVRLDAMEKTVASMSSFVSPMMDKLKVHDEFQSSLKSSMEALDKRTANDLSSLRKDSSSHIPEMKSLKDSLDQANAKSDSFVTQLSKLQSNVSDVSSKLGSFSKKEDVLSFKDALEIHSVKSSDRFVSLEMNLLSIIEDQKALKISHQKLSASIDEIKQILEKHGSVIASTLSDLAQSKSNLSQAQKDSKQSLEKMIDDKISAIPKPVIPTIDDLHKKLSSKIEPATNDAKNANLRSTNNESRIMILEKRVEQLQLLLNKYQIEAAK